jgi:ATP-dependent Clp protease ATP-binding subunit ClpA
MFERFTQDARDVVTGATEAARSLGHAWVGSEHLLLAAVSLPDDEVADALRHLGLTPETVSRALLDELGSHHDDTAALRDLGIDLEAVRRRVEERFGEGALDHPPTTGGLRRLLPRRTGRSERHVPFTREGKKVLELALREALRLQSREIGAGHLVLGMLRAGGMTSRVLSRANVFPGDARRAVGDVLRKAA